MVGADCKLPNHSSNVCALGKWLVCSYATPDHSSWMVGANCKLPNHLSHVYVPRNHLSNRFAKSCFVCSITMLHVSYCHGWRRSGIVMVQYVTFPSRRLGQVAHGSWAMCHVLCARLVQSSFATLVADMVYMGFSLDLHIHVECLVRYVYKTFSDRKPFPSSPYMGGWMAREFGPKWFRNEPLTTIQIVHPKCPTSAPNLTSCEKSISTRCVSLQAMAL